MARKMGESVSAEFNAWYEGQKDRVFDNRLVQET